MPLTGTLAPATSSRRRPLPASVVGAIVGLLALAGLTIAQSPARSPLTPQRAIRVALHDPSARAALAGDRWNTMTADPIDDRLERVSFFDHGRIVAEVAVDRTGHVELTQSFAGRPVPYGDWIAYEPAVLAGLAALFTLMAGVAPLRRMRNVDVAMILSLVAPVVLLQQRYVDASVVSALPGLSYLLGRCAWRALGPAPGSRSSVPLIVALTPGLRDVERVRWLRALVLALALIYLMVGISSPAPVDVAYAVMEGATKLVHGVLPYGHLPGDVVHGDTYPLLSYVLYVPIALIAPVTSTWNSVDAALAVAALAALATAWVLFRYAGGVTRAHAGRVRRRVKAPAEQQEALRLALAWLAFPPLLAIVSSGTTDVVMALMLVVAILLWWRPAASSGLVAAAAWFKLAPLALLPIWLAPQRGRRLAASLAAVGGVSAVMVGTLLALGGLHGPVAMIHAMSYQFARGSPQSVWSALDVPGLQPVCEAALLGFVAAAAVRLRREPQLGEDPARIAALAAAVLIGLELASSYWAFLYLAWFAPLLCLSIHEPGAEPATRRMPAEWLESTAVALRGALAQ